MTTPLQSSIGSVRAATDIMGDKWTPELLRYFLNERVVRFCQLQDLVGDINPRTLSARLAKLENEGVITKNPTTTEKRCEYILTEKGKALLPVLSSMQEWSAQYGSQK